MRHPSRTVEQVLARIAAAQHGVVTRTQLLAADVSRAEIRGRLRSGVLLREHPGVYRVGHRAPSLHSSYMAAVFACGEGALLSGRAAGYLLGLLKGSPPKPEVTMPKQRRIAGIRTRRSRSLDGRRDAMTFHRIPVTTVPRTLVDLAAALTVDDLPVPATKLASATGPLRRRSRPFSQAARTAQARRSSVACSAATLG